MRETAVLERPRADAFIEEHPFTEQPASAEHTEWISEETYAHSLRLLESLGKTALENELDTDRGRLLKEMARDEWESSLIEMINTDAEFRDRLEITRERRHDIRQGQVVCVDAAGTATPMVELIKRGADRAEAEITTDPRMRFQAERDKNDLYNAQEVDTLAPGMMRVVVSMDPKAAFKEHGREFVEGLGYREGWASIQGYWLTPDGNEMATFTYTINDSDMAVMREVCNALGATIPADVTENAFIRHPILAACQDMAQARSVLLKIRDQAYQKQGITTTRYSVDEFLSQNQELVTQVFDSQYMELATAHAFRYKNETVHAFAQALLDSPLQLEAKIHARLQAVCRTSKLEHQDVQLLEYLLRYGLIERLRPALRYIGNKKLATLESFAMPAGTQQLPYEHIARSLATNALAGIRAGRTYGGCTRGLDIKLDDTDKNKRDPLDPFGGYDKEDGSKEESRKSWKLTLSICRVKDCPSRGKNPDKPLKVLCGPCGVCMGRCQKLFDAGKDPTL